MRSLLSIGFVMTLATVAIADPATPLPPAAARSAAHSIQIMATAEMPGMIPDGAVAAAEFKEGQTLEIPFTLQPGKCYGVVGLATGRIVQLDLAILFKPAPQFPASMLAQSYSRGPTAVLGGKLTGCWKNTFPSTATATVRVTATKGDGTAYAQVFVK